MEKIGLFLTPLSKRNFENSKKFSVYIDAQASKNSTSKNARAVSI
jgi:hypothetical protein